MIDPATTQLWLYRGLYLSSAFGLILVGMVPLSFVVPFVAAPDLLVSLTFAWILRRPDYVPFWAILVIFLLADILQMRPVGLWTAIILVATEFLRARSYGLRELAFAFEWALVSVVVFIAVALERIILTMTFVPVPSFGASMIHLIVTILAYPFVVLICYFVLRLHKVTPAEAIGLGHRL